MWLVASAALLLVVGCAESQKASQQWFVERAEATGLDSLHVDDFPCGRRRRYRLPTLPERFNMELDGFTNQQQGLIAAVCCRYATRKIGNICTERCRAFFNHHEVLHSQLS